MAYTLPDDVDARPITIVGAGTLGRRIAAMYAAGGSEVRIVDPAEDQRAAARDFVSANAEDIRRRSASRPIASGPSRPSRIWPRRYREPGW